MVSCRSVDALLALIITAGGVRAFWEFPCIGTRTADEVVSPNLVLAGFNDPLVKGSLVFLSTAIHLLGHWHRLTS